MKKAILALIFLTLISHNAHAVFDPEAVDRIVTLTIPLDGPGGALLISEKDRVIYRKAFGYADVEDKVKNTPETVFQVGSISKMMTAAGILLLAEQGKLSLRDKLTRYIPDFIEPASDVTIKNLLQHDSGIKSFTAVPEWRPAWESKRTLASVIDLVKNKAFDFQPGEKYRYNNSGYAILAYIIEQVSGLTYGDFMKKNIFLPLGMTHTRHGGDTDDIGVRATGYSRNHQAKKITRSIYTEFAQLSGAGSVISTVDDLLLFDRAMKKRKLLSEKSWKKAVSGQVDVAPTMEYGYGWMIQKSNGHEIIWHNGGMPGFLSANYIFRDADVTVIYLSNTDFVNADSMVNQVARYMFNVDAVRRKPVQISEDILKRYEGTYLFMGDKYDITLKDGQLRYQIRGYNYPVNILVPTSENTFYIDGRYDVYITVPDELNSPVTYANLEFNGQKLKFYKDGSEPKTVMVIEEELEKYTGEFRFQNDLEVKVYIQDGELRAFLKGQPVYMLDPIGGHKFRLKGLTGFMFVFKVGASGEITGVMSSQPNGDFYAERVK